jgi:hypothetical protein
MFTSFARSDTAADGNRLKLGKQPGARGVLIDVLLEAGSCNVVLKGRAHEDETDFIISVENVADVTTGGGIRLAAMTASGLYRADVSGLSDVWADVTAVSTGPVTVKLRSYPLA